MDFKKIVKLSRILIKLKEYEIPEKGKMIINGDELAVGIDVVDEQGEPFADGEYEVDGKKVIVKDGKIDAVEPAEGQAEPEPVAPQPEVKEPEHLEVEAEPSQPADPQKDDKDLKIEELEGLLADRDAIIEELNTKIKELEDKIVKPVEEPVKMAKTPIEKLQSNVGENKALKFFQD